MIRSIIVAGALALTPVYALANGFYLDLLAGQSEVKSDVDNEGVFKGDDLSLGLQFGYQFLPFLAVEAGYTDHGEASKKAFVGNYKADTQVANLGLKFILPIGDVVRLYARGGVGWWENEYSYTVAGVTVSDDDKGNDFYVGLGAHFNVNDFVYLGIEANHMKFDTDVNGSDSENTLNHAAFKVGFYF